MTLNHIDSTVTDPVEIANIFSNHFACAAEKAMIKDNAYSHKHINECIENVPSKSFFLSPTNKREILIIISSLDANKSVGSNSIPTNILKLLKDEISSHLSDIYKISFSVGVFQSVLKTTKAISYIKMTLSSTAITFAQYLFYQILRKF